MRCAGCGGQVGVDCFNPQECEWITRDMANRYEQQLQQPQPDNAVLQVDVLEQALTAKDVEIAKLVGLLTRVRDHDISLFMTTNNFVLPQELREQISECVPVEA